LLLRYPIFNEGYAATPGARLQRVELSAEAIRLARMVHRLLPDDAEGGGLLGLMLLTHPPPVGRPGPGGAGGTEGPPGPGAGGAPAPPRGGSGWGPTRWPGDPPAPTSSKPPSPPS